MSAEVAVYEANGIVQRQDSMQNAAVARLGDWAESAQAAYEVARRLVETSFVPSQFKGKPAEATAAILAGAEVGLSPMAALKSFDIIQGTAAPRALTLRAIVQSQGHEMVLDESTETRCKMRGRRRGEAEWTKVQWTIDRAKGLGLTTKDNWKKQPAAMLVARATGELARLIAADAILGIGYTIEEVADGADVNINPDDAPEGEAPTSGTRKMQRKPAEEVNRDSIPDDQDLITDKQSALLHKLAGDLELDREAKLAGISVIVGRNVETSKDLTRIEAGKVIDSLTATLAERRGELPVEGGDAE